VKYNIAIDLGSSNTVILKNEVGVALVEPTLILLDEDRKNPVISFGKEAKESYPAQRETCKLVSPIKNGVIVNKDLAKSLLKHFLDKIEEPMFFKGNLLWLVPGSISQNDKNEFINLGYALGYKNVEVLPSAIAGLQQLEVEYDNPYSHVLVNIGGGATDVSVVYKGKVIQGCSIDIGGEVVDNQIQKFLIDNYNMVVTTVHSEEIKKELSSILPNDLVSYTMKGTNIDVYTNQELTITAQEIRDIYISFYEKICNAVSAVLNMCNSQIVRDVNKTGVYVCGGMANMIGLEKFMKARLNVNVYIDDRPETTVIFGAEKLFNEPNKLNYLVQLNN